MVRQLVQSHVEMSLHCVKNIFKIVADTTGVKVASPTNELSRTPTGEMRYAMLVFFFPF
jgi:hypothetical protein